MAELVAAVGTSHTPLLVVDVDLWPELGRRDRGNPMLYDSQGRHRSYDDLAAEMGDRFADHLHPEVLAHRSATCQQALDRLAADLAAAEPDVVVIVGDDQHELFGPANQPAMAIFWGDEMRTGVSGAPPSPVSDQIKTGYAMDRHHVFAGHPGLALDLIGSLMEQGFDVASVASNPAASGGGEVAESAHDGFGHAYGFVARRLLDGAGLDGSGLDGNVVPIVPVLLNTFYPPNQPSPARCHDLGRALARAVAESAQPLRVALVASGGLSHFVVDEALDEIVVDALRSGSGQPLRTLPAHLLEAGSSEIRNWITVAGALEGRPVDWLEYVPVRRSPAGTGVGCAFASWRFS
jgi:Catalytic LigB subunit of aromatic ring-opening dioxygenase